MITCFRLVKCFEKFKNRNNIYAVQFFFFEILNLVNVLVQINYINKFLGGRFVDYGSQLFQFYNHIDMGIDPMVEVFPKVTKCQFNRHGPGGDIIVRLSFKIQYIYCHTRLHLGYSAKLRI